MFLGNTAVHSNKGEEKNRDSDDGNGETDAINSNRNLRYHNNGTHLGVNPYK